MQFDIRTLLVAAALATAFCTGARVLLWRMHPGVPGLGHWAWAGALGVFAFALIVAHATVPGMWLLSLAQVLFAAGLALAWDGFRLFCDRAPLSLPLLVVLALGVLAPIALAGNGHSLGLRASSNALAVALFSALIARELLSDARQGRVAMRATGWVYAANGAFFAVRAITVMLGGRPGNGMNPDGLAALPLLWWLCISVAVTLGMVLMLSERLQAELDRQASRDPLTGALNRRAFALVAEKEVAWARRNGQPLSVLMMDLDHFKEINDRLGHSVGDEVLCRFVTAADRVLRGGDVFCRFGGEEFVALLPGTPADRALAVAERLRDVYAEETAFFTNAAQSLPFAITVSVGVGELGMDEEIDSVIRRADAALYQAKSSGRNRCELAADGLGAVSAAAAPA